jgi:hypothetical protein
MFAGSSSSTPGLARFGKLFFGLIGGLAVIVLSVGLVGEFGVRRAAEEPVVSAEKTAAATVGTPPPRTDSGSAPAAAHAPEPAAPPVLAPAPIRTEREPPSRNASTRPLAIGGPPRPDQFKPAEPGPAPSSVGDVAAAPTAAGDAPASAPAEASRKVRVIAIERQRDEAAREAAKTGRAGVQAAAQTKRKAELPLPPRPAPPVRRADAVDAGDMAVRAPVRGRSPRPERDEALPVARAAASPPFKPEPVATQQNPRRAAAVEIPLGPSVPVAAPIRRVATERIPNLDQAYRRMQAERRRALERPLPRQSRVVLAQPRRLGPAVNVERPPPGQRLVVMHLRTYRGPDGELFDVLSRRPPQDDRPRFSEARPGSWRDSVIDWVNR